MKTIKAQSAALARVCRLYTAAKRHGQEVSVAELELALEGVDVQGLAHPRSCVVRNVGLPLESCAQG